MKSTSTNTNCTGYTLNFLSDCFSVSDLELRRLWCFVKIFVYREKQYLSFRPLFTDPIYFLGINNGFNVSNYIRFRTWRRVLENADVYLTLEWPQLVGNITKTSVSWSSRISRWTTSAVLPWVWPIVWRLGPGRRRAGWPAAIWRFPSSPGVWLAALRAPRTSESRGIT